jgi:YHS domain-containing protein
MRILSTVDFNPKTPYASNMRETVMTRRVLGLVFGLATLLCAGSPANAQTAESGALRLALKGYDPVAYFTDGKPTPGKREFEIVFDDARYRFASGKHMRAFENDPEQYAPQFGGACTYGLSKGVKVEANPEVWRIVDGKLFVFAGTKVPEDMDKHPQATITEAEKNWKALRDRPF